MSAYFISDVEREKCQARRLEHFRAEELISGLIPVIIFMYCVVRKTENNIQNVRQAYGPDRQKIVNAVLDTWPLFTSINFRSRYYRDLTLSG